MVITGIWLETLKNVENEKHTLQDLGYGKKTNKHGKKRQAHCRSWNMMRKTEKGRN